MPLLSPLTPSRGNAGFQRTEGCWILVMVVVCTWVILGTHRREIESADIRHAQDGLAHLSGRLERDLPTGAGLWEGPGESAVLKDASQDLADLLRPRGWLTADPWGGAWLLRITEQSAELISMGPDGVLDSADDLKVALQRRPG
ncbi:MAG: hypothetical protein MK213_06345 [Planctomycetes bacterium]|nr:hypothetical protein [Planctomycetota bacterium]